MSNLNEISELLQKGRAPQVKEQIAAALNEGVTAETILNDALFAGMAVIGEKFKNNQVFIPEVLIAARAMNAGIEVLKPYLVNESTENKGTVVIGTVKGDLHDIGKNIVKIMLEGKGLNVIDLGTDVAPERFVQEAVANNAKIICCSALLTTTMVEMKNVVEAAKNAGVRDKIKIMLGGAPVTQEFCDSVGADYYTPDAASCADIAISVCSEN